MKCLILTFSFFLGLNLFGQETNFFNQAQVQFTGKFGCNTIQQKDDKIHALYKGDRFSGYALKWIKYDLSGIRTKEIVINCPYSDYDIGTFDVLNDGGVVYSGTGIGSSGPGSFIFKLDSNGTEKWSLRDSVGLHYESELIDDSTLICVLELSKSFRKILAGKYLIKLNTNNSDIEIINEFGTIKNLIPQSGLLFSQIKRIDSSLILSFKTYALDTSFLLKINMKGELISSSNPISGNIVGFDSYKDHYILALEKSFGIGLRTSIFTLNTILKLDKVINTGDSGSYQMLEDRPKSNSKRVMIPIVEMDSLRTYFISRNHWYDPEKGLLRKCKYTVEDETLRLSQFQVFSNYSFLSTARYMDWTGYFSFILKTDSLGLVYNTDIVCECEDFNTGIESKEKSELHIAVFPNPASERVVVQLPHDQKAEIALRNTNGQVIIKQLTRIQRNELDVSALPRGIYLLEVKTEDLVGMRKIVVE